MIHVETILILADTDIEHHTSYLCSKATSVANNTCLAETLFKEGRIDLVIQAHKQGNFRSFRAATTTYDVPRSTARLRVKGVKPKRDSIAPNRRLTPAQEESLKQWILSMD